MLDFFFYIRQLISNRQEIQKLASQIEICAKQLNGLSAKGNISNENDVVSVLRTSCILLESFINNRFSMEEEETQDKKHETGDISVGKVDFDAKGDTLKEKTEPEEVLESKSLSSSTTTEPSETAKEIIKLQDWLFVAKSRDDASTIKTLEILYGKLNKTLSKEGIITLEENGLFDENKQSAVETIDTNDPSKNNMVSDTVRPGYLFNDEVFRPQDVVVYVYRED